MAQMTKRDIKEARKQRDKRLAKSQSKKKISDKPYSKAFLKFLKTSNAMNSMIPVQSFVSADGLSEQIQKNSSYFQYITIKCYPEAEMTAWLEQAIFMEETITLDRFTIATDSDRYLLYTTKGCTCAHCGLKATFWALQDNARKITTPHLNLYGVKEGRIVMMTKDHILPRSRGGEDKLSNYQPLCEDCNRRKGSKKEEELIIC